MSDSQLMTCRFGRIEMPATGRERDDAVADGIVMAGRLYARKGASGRAPHARSRVCGGSPRVAQSTGNMPESLFAARSGCAWWAALELVPRKVKRRLTDSTNPTARGQSSDQQLRERRCKVCTRNRPSF